MRLVPPINRRDPIRLRTMLDRPCVLSLALLLLACHALSAESEPPPPNSNATAADGANTPVPEAKPEPPTPLELQPYRVRVSVAFAEHPLITHQTRQEILSGLARWIERTYGEMWTASVEEHPTLSPPGRTGLSRLTWPSLDAQIEDRQLDKVFVLCVSVQGSLWQLCGREWDRLSEQLSELAERQVADRRALVSELGVLLRELFHPLLRVESAQDRSAVVRVRAGEFPAPDPSVDQLSPGTYFQPIMRYFSKEHELQKVQLVPWTYLLVEKSERARGECSIHTGLRVPIGRNSKRLESWAIGVRPTFAQTTLRITPHNNPTKPLIGYQVNVYERRLVPVPPEDAAENSQQVADAKSDATAKTSSESGETEVKKPEEPQLAPQFHKLQELVTDRRGRVTVPLDPQHPLVWLYVSSGGSLLGRFPFIPGTASSIVAELPDDSLRLDVESRLELLRAELIDAIARRALLTARAKGAAIAADWPRFEELLRELDRQPTAKYFQTQLDAIKVSTLKSASDKKDKRLEGKVDRLCKESVELINRLLNDERLKEQRAELVELKKADQDATAREGLREVPKRRPSPAPAAQPPAAQ